MGDVGDPRKTESALFDEIMTCQAFKFQAFKFLSTIAS